MFTFTLVRDGDGGSTLFPSIFPWVECITYLLSISSNRYRYPDHFMYHSYIRLLVKVLVVF